MNLTISSFITSLWMVSLIVLGVQLLLIKSKRPFSLGILEWLFVFVFFRLIFPLEFTLTETIPDKISGTLIAYGYSFQLSTPIIIGLLWFWGIGAIWKCWRYSREIQEGIRFKRILQKNETCHSLNRISLYYSSYISSPIVLFGKTIVVPKGKYTEEELKDILAHEQIHIQHHDFLWKQIVNVLCILYWWFPIVYVLKKQVYLFLEVRADNQVTQDFDSRRQMLYVQHLLEVAKKEFKTSHLYSFQPNPVISESFQPNPSTLTYRVRYLLNRIDSSEKNRAIMCLLIFTLLSTFIVFEPYGPNSLSEDVKAIDERGTLIREVDNSLHLYIGGEDMGLVQKETISQED